jgi:hypothetical protein
MDTIENRLIAEFDGWKYYPVDKYCHFARLKRGDEAMSASAMKYHSDWNELMPVVEKIESMTVVDGRGEVNYVFTIEANYCVISQGGEAPLFENQHDTKIQCVFQTVIDFIQWYNTTKNS